MELLSFFVVSKISFAEVFAAKVSNGCAASAAEHTANSAKATAVDGSEIDAVEELFPVIVANF